MRQLVLDLAPAPAPTLRNFIAGRNAAAVQALTRALAGGEPFVFLWGPPGSGKSHLLMGFAAEAGASAIYLRAGAPDWEGAQASRAIAVDDVALLDGGQQVALFDLYNRARNAGGAVVASGATPPLQVGVREDLRSRLGSGVVLQLHRLDDEEKASALREHAKSRGMVLGEDMIRYLLTHFDRDMGTQIRVLDALDRYSLAHHRAVSLPLLRQALQEPAPGSGD
ncbi:MAG: DnaA regulatory inactivator Hda [Betaproteobacteria bacterium]|nr:DnaA regulatory inactivator Hda [Betaproteobacteria bacterium]